MKIEVTAFQIANSLNIQACKTALEQEIIFSDKDELFSTYGSGYLYLFRYGVICTANLDSEVINQLKRELYNFYDTSQFTGNSLTETLLITTNAERFKEDFDGVYITGNDVDKIRLIMLNTSQSVALNYYAEITEKLLKDTREHTNFLELRGKLDISGKKLKRYIGKVLNVKNKISENLYIFDSPEMVWEDESLNHLNTTLKQKFDLKDRYQTINQQLNIIKENLDLFKEIMFHKESSKLEWIIILLILVEVVDLFILKIWS